MKEELTQKQKLFCLEYLKDFNATRAYREVYWVSQKTAEASWCRMLSNDKVAEYLQSKAQKKVEKIDVWVDYVLENLKNIVEIWSWRVEVEKNWKKQKIYDFTNVNSALEKLWKYNKMYTDKVEQDGSLSINIVSYKKWQN